MKIRIKKSSKLIQEKELSMSKKGGYDFLQYYNKFLNKDSKDYLFNKKIILYDLETKGLLPSPYIHQFAALEFDLSQTGLEGIDVNNLVAKDAFIAKCYYSYEDMRGQDKSFQKKRANFRYAFSDAYNKERDLMKISTYPYLTTYITALLTTRYDATKKKYITQMNISKNNMPKLYGAMVFGMALAKLEILRKADKDTKAQPIQIQDLNVDYVNFIEVIKEKYKNDRVFNNDKVIQDGLGMYFDNLNKNTILKEIYDSLVPSPKTTIVAAQAGFQKPNYLNGLSHFWNFISRLKANFPITHTEPDYYKKYNPFSLTMKKITDEIGMSYGENKQFTKYKTFPLKKYVSYNDDLARAESDKQFAQNYRLFVPNTKTRAFNRNDTVVPDEVPGQPKPPSYRTTLVSEKHALESFLDWFGNKNKEEGKFLLMGQNIAAFDNAVIQNRAKKYGLQSKFVNNFFDSMMFDTLSFFKSAFIPTMKFFEKVQEDIDKYSKTVFDLYAQRKTPEQQPGDFNPVYESLVTANLKLEAMRKKYPNLRSKLDGLMVMFYGENHVQTHTADDDCEQLLRIFLPTFQEVKVLIDFFGDTLYDVQNILQNVFGKGYTINLGITSYPSPSQSVSGTNPVKTELNVGEVDKIASKLKNDIMVYAEFDPSTEKITVYGNKDFDNEYSGFNAVFGGKTNKVFDLLKPKDYNKIQLTLQNSTTPQGQKLAKKYPLGILNRLEEFLKVLFKNYIIDTYNREDYDQVFDLMKNSRTDTIDLLKKIIKNNFKTRPPKAYDFEKKYLDYNFYAKYNADATTVKENKKRIKLKILKENKNGKTTRNQRA